MAQGYAEKVAAVVGYSTTRRHKIDNGLQRLPFFFLPLRMCACMIDLRLKPAEPKNDERDTKTFYLADRRLPTLEARSTTPTSGAQHLTCSPVRPIFRVVVVVAAAPRAHHHPPFSPSLPFSTSVWRCRLGTVNFASPSFPLPRKPRAGISRLWRARLYLRRALLPMMQRSIVRSSKIRQYKIAWIWSATLLPVLFCHLSMTISLVF